MLSSLRFSSTFEFFLQTFLLLPVDKYERLLYSNFDEATQVNLVKGPKVHDGS